MATTIGGTINHGVVLQTPTYSNPVTVTGTIIDANADDTALLGASPTVWTIVNQGVIEETGTVPSTAILLQSGGTVTNTGLIQANGVGISTFTTGTVANYGTVVGGTSGGAIHLVGGVVTNGLNGLIQGGYGIFIATLSGTVSNLGTVLSTTGLPSVWIANNPGNVNGVVTNGAAGSTTALIKGGGGVGFSGIGTVANFGQIVSTNPFGANYSYGVNVTGTASSVTNGAAGSTGASIVAGGVGVEISGGADTITNFGTITATSTNGSAVDLLRGGNVVNGANNSTVALIQSANAGVQRATNVTNYGTIVGTLGLAVGIIGTVGTVTNAGLITGAGGIAGATTTVANSGTIIATATNGIAVDITGTGGAVTNTGAIAGGYGGIKIDQAGTVTNMATITGGTGRGVFIGSGGAVANGNAGATGKLIAGASYGVDFFIYGAGTLTNFGTIAATATSGIGADLRGGGSLVNGASGSTAWLIQGGRDGADGATNMTNYGTIVGTAGYGIYGGSGGTITNAVNALITGASGISDAASAVVNSATITATVGSGVHLHGTSGIVTNTGVIKAGYDGVRIDHAGTVTNLGVISGTTDRGVFIGSGGAVANGNASATGKSIAGASYGVEFFIYGAGTLTNFGTITATATSGIGADLRTGGILVNGASGATGWLIQGGKDGADGATNLTNYGTVAGTAGYGVYGGSGGTITNAPNALITGASGIVDGANSVANSGTVAATAGFGVHLTGTSGAVTNTGVIKAGYDGVRIDHSGAVTNLGVIIGSTDRGVFIGAGGGVANGNATATGKSIAGASYGVEFFIYGAGSLTNFGTIAATATSGIGVDLRAGGSVTNGGGGYPSAVVKGNTGIVLYGTAATLTTFGTIVGTGGVAVQFGNGNNRLIVEPGAVFNGKVENQGGSNTVELAAGAAAGTLTGLGTSIVNFGSVAFDTGAAWTVTMDNPPAFTGTIAGFTGTGDAIDLTSLLFAGNTSVGFSSTTNVLTVTEGGGAATIQLDSENYSGVRWVAKSDGVSGTDVTVACFCRGTLILTERGEVPAEELAIGDRVITISGAARPIKWIGRRSYAGRFAVGQKHILPVCVKASALADGVPRRDLRVSPNHALYLEEVLVEARDLVNGVSIVQAERVETVEYFHVELDSHDVIVAEGAAAESFIDDDSRGLFHNAPEYRALYPDERNEPARYCAPRRDQGYEVERARTRIARRAGLAVAAEVPPLGALRGEIDEVGRRRICGWAQDAARPEASVCLDIHAGGGLIGQVVANRYRADLAAAGLDSGRHGFEFVPPPGLAFTPRSIQVRRSLEDASLTCSKTLKQSVARRPRNTSAR